MQGMSLAAPQPEVSLFESLAAPYRDAIEREVESIFKMNDGGSPIYKIMRYHTGWYTADFTPCQARKGKLARSTLCLLVHQALGGHPGTALPAAAAVELIHNGSLMIDDVYDHDNIRRGRPAVWKLWGEPQAVLAGLAMQALMNFAGLRLHERDVPLPKCTQALKLLTRTLLQMCEGQYLDMVYEALPTIGFDDYLKMLAGKTASLIATTCQIGALLASDDEQQIERYRRYGHELGLIYQMVDDMLGIWGTVADTGKANNSDLIYCKKSFPIVYAWQLADQENRCLIEQIYSKRMLSREDCNRLRDIFEKLDLKSACHTAVLDHTETAQEMLRATGVDNHYQDQLQRLTYVAAFRLN